MFDGRANRENPNNTGFSPTTAMVPNRAVRIQTISRNIQASIDVATRAGEWARIYKRNEGISAIDYLIAATAEVHGADLLTQNVKHFPMFPELTPAIDV